MIEVTKELIRRFEKNTKLVNGCMEYQGNLHQEGYARFGRNVNGKSVQLLIHRAIAHFYHGLDLKNRKSMACHTCDNPRCINKKHIYIGNAKTNIMDAIKRGRYKQNNTSTHCPAGHEYVPEITRYVKKRNGFLNKRCLLCHRAESLTRSKSRRERNLKLYGFTRSPREKEVRKQAQK